MGFQLDVQITASVVFLQGFLSFFSPCVLPLLPLYMGYLAGGTAARDADGQICYDRSKVFWHTLFFVIGITFTFFLLGLGMTMLGRFLGRYQTLIGRIGGILVLLLGMLQLGLFDRFQLPVLSGEHRLPLHPSLRKMTPATALLLGFVFSFAWTPCVGPALSSVLLMAASSGTASGSNATGFLLIGLYTLGFVLPFLAVGLFTTSLLSLLQRHRDVVRYTVKAGGLILILMGVMMLTGSMNRVSTYFAGLGATTGTPSQTIDGDDQVADQIPVAMTETNTGKTGTVESTVSAEGQTSSESASVHAPADDTSTPENSSITTDASVSNVADRPVYTAPDFDLLDQYGTPQRLSDYRGKVVFLNFWATWCPPCRMEMPDIQKLYEYYDAHPEENVIILGMAAPKVGQEQDEEGIAMFLLENGYSYPVAFDTGGKLMHTYAISAFPTTYMIDADGNLFGYVAGAISEEIMQSIIEQTKSGHRE